MKQPEDQLETVLEGGDPMELLTVKEFCKEIKLSPPTVYKLAKEGKIELLKIAGVNASRIRRGTINSLLRQA